MTTYRIESKAGVIFGEYEGATPEEAFAAMVADIGGDGEDADGRPTAGTVDDWFITPVGPITRADESLIREWLDCGEASVDTAGDVWIADPMAGRWLDAEDKANYRAWRDKRA